MFAFINLILISSSSRLFIVLGLPDKQNFTSIFSTLLLSSVYIYFGSLLVPFCMPLPLAFCYYVQFFTPIIMTTFNLHFVFFFRYCRYWGVHISCIPIFALTSTTNFIPFLFYLPEPLQVVHIILFRFLLCFVGACVFKTSAVIGRL